jgi:hypothetical protein
MLTKDDLAFIDANWPSSSRESMARRLGVRHWWVRQYCSEKGFSRPAGRPVSNPPNKKNPGGGIDKESRARFFTLVNAIAGL